MTNLRRWLAGACVVAALSLAGCSSADPGTTEKTSSGARPSTADAPRDRDESAVLAALRQLDFCAVLTAAQPGSAAKPVSSEPFSCAIVGDPGGSVGIVGMSGDTRLKMPMRAIGGARAYVDFSKSDRCQVDLPISFELVLEFDVNRKGPCGRYVDQFVSAAVEALGDPAAVAADPNWDACSALTEALGGADALIPTSAFVGGACERWDPTPAHLDFGYSDPIVGRSRNATVGGVTVAVQEEDSTGKSLCWMSWRSAPDQWVGVATTDCARAKALAESVMKVLATAPPRGRPQQPLLYGADEPDSPFRGACAHLEPTLAKHCAPYAEVAVPDGRDAVLRAAETDAAVQCAVARAAVAEQFGPQLVPVTVDDGDTGSCYFVEPARQVQVRFHLGSDSIAGVPEVFKVHEATIAGHPGYVADAQRAYEVWVAMSGDPDTRGSVEVSVDGGPASDNAGPPADAAAKAGRTIAEVVQQYGWS